MSGVLPAGLALLIALQTVVFLCDELIYHRRRGLDAFERWGHPVDSVLFAAALACPAFLDASPFSLALFAVVGTASTLLITKDERIHHRSCCAMEHWLHSLLFVLHGPILIGFGWLWSEGLEPWNRLVQLYLAGIAGWTAYQILFWMKHENKPASAQTLVPATSRNTADQQ